MPSALLQVCEMAVQNDDTIEGRRGICWSKVWEDAK